MSQTGEDLLIIYETEAKQWATYLQSVFTGPILEAGICCYDVATLSGRRDDFLRLSCYTCKILILTKGMLEDFCQPRRFFLSRVLSPASSVVVLLCGVESLTPLLDLVPLNGDECLQLSCEQDASEYLSTVIKIIRKDLRLSGSLFQTCGAQKLNEAPPCLVLTLGTDKRPDPDDLRAEGSGTSATAANVNPLKCKQSASKPKVEQIHSCGANRVRSNIVVIPSRVPCGSSTEVFVLLKNDAAGCDCVVEFSVENQIVREKPFRWNERILCVNAPDFPAGNVRVTVYSGGKALSNTQLEYYTNTEELACLLSRVTDPVAFMCQALQVSSVDKLDQKLSSMLLEGMPTGGFQGLKSESIHARELHHADVPSLLHFAAQYGFRNVSGLLLQCPGADRALCTVNRHGQTPTEIAKRHGHMELHILLKETLKMFDSGEDNGDASVYEMMCNADVRKQQQDEDKDEEDEDDDLYAPLGVNDEYDTTLNPEKALVIANRPPAPTPRPEGIMEKDSNTPYIAQVFQKKKTPQGDAELYSLPTKQARGGEGSITSTYDTFIPNQMHKLQGLVEFQQRLKAGSRTDESLEHSSDWQQVQKGTDAKQEEKLSHLRANNRNDDSVYDKINIVHHTSSVAINERRRVSEPVVSDFYSKPLKGQQMFRKSDKR